MVRGICCSAVREQCCYMLGLALQGSMRSSYLSPSPPISGRDISALAVIRRPSWSGAARTASYDGGSATAAGTQVSLTPRLSASLHAHVLYGALDPTAMQEHPRASTVFSIWCDRLGHYVAGGEALWHRLPMLCHLHMCFSRTSHQTIAAHKLSAWTLAVLGISAYMGSDWDIAQQQQYFTKLL